MIKNNFEKKKLISENNVDETEECILLLKSAIFYESEIYDEIDSKKQAIIVSSLVEDQFLKTQNYFSRGPPGGILGMCSDFWNGKTVEPINGEINQKINSILQQWNSSNIQSIAFSYRPQKKYFVDILNHFDV